MATPSSVELRPRGVGELLDVTFSVYRRHFLALLGTALVVMGPLTALTLISNGASVVQLAGTWSFSDMDGNQDIWMTTALLATAVSMCASGIAFLAGALAPWMGGAVTYSVIERVLGRAPDWRAAYKAAAPRWGALWVANLVRQFTLVACALPAIVGLYGALFAGLTLAVADASVTDGTTFGGTAAMLGLMAACLPVGVLGLALAAWVGVSWSLSEPVVVGEGAGAFQSLSRSSALVTGMRWRMLGRLVIFWIMQFMVVTVPIFLLQTLLLGGALVATETGDVSATTLAGYVVASVFGVAAGVLLAPLNVIYVTMNYLDLRVRKEQLDLQLRAAELATTSTTTITSTSTSTSTSASSSASASASTVVEADTVLIPSQRISGLFEQIARQGESAELLNELALAHRQAGDLDGALDALSRARELAPNDAGVAYNLALVRRARREDAAARRALADYLNLEDDPQLRQQARDDPAWKDYL